MTTTHPSANDSGLNLDHLEALARAATPGRWMRLFGERTVYDRMEDGCRGNAIVRADLGYGLRDSNLDFIAAASPVAVLELIALARRAALANQPAPTVPAGSRERFETWARDQGMSDDDLKQPFEGRYFWERTSDMWSTWQAAQEQAEAVFVTRESALDAIRHVAESSIPGKTIRAAHMLVPARATQQEPLAAPQQAAAPAALDERAEFENWLGRPMMNPDKPSHYNGGSVRTAWEAWQERARRHQAPSVPGTPEAPKGSIGDFTEFHVLLNWYDNEASYGSINEGRNKLTEYIDKWADRRAAQLDGGQEGSGS